MMGSFANAEGVNVDVVEGKLIGRWVVANADVGLVKRECPTHDGAVKH